MKLLFLMVRMGEGVFWWESWRPTLTTSRLRRTCKLTTSRSSWLALKCPQWPSRKHWFLFRELASRLPSTPHPRDILLLTPLAFGMPWPSAWPPAGNGPHRRSCPPRWRTGCHPSRAGLRRWQFWTTCWFYSGNRGHYEWLKDGSRWNAKRTRAELFALCAGRTPCMGPYIHHSL